MERYDYERALREDILEYFNEHGVTGFVSDEERDRLYDEMWVSDSVTGNASGSYTFSTWKAEENLCHNVDLMEEVIDEWGKPDGFNGAEWWDVSIRCYLLGRVLDEVVSKWNEVHPEADENEEV